MALLFGFVLFCCVAWWWLKGSAFAAFVVALALCDLVTIGAGETTHTPVLLHYVVAVAIACLPHYLRTEGLALLWQIRSGWVACSRSGCGDDDGRGMAC